MANTPELQLNLDLPFPEAGIVFNISVDTRGGDSSGFRLSVTDSKNGEPVPFTSDRCPQLADWVRGYSRWLYRARLRATHDENGISGEFVGDPTSEDILEGIRAACDMIHQRFDLYDESILV